jgi:hypothetical protein
MPGTFKHTTQKKLLHILGLTNGAAFIIPAQCLSCKGMHTMRALTTHQKQLLRQPANSAVAGE